MIEVESVDRHIILDDKTRKVRYKNDSSYVNGKLYVLRFNDTFPFSSVVNVAEPQVCSGRRLLGDCEKSEAMFELVSNSKI